VAELGTRSGAANGSFVKEVTDEPGLAKAEQDARQMHHAASLSARAKLIKRADKVANVREAAHRPSHGLDAARTGQGIIMNQEGCLRAIRNKRRQNARIRD
jgi:GTP diphosphokinase / guanosine-3',5'-bis(diphosphate) 3'-diphosphatase